MESPREKILVVDDEESIRKICKRILEKQNYEVTEAENGIVALDKLEQQPYDIVVTDLQMSKLGGRELLENIKKTYKATDVIVMTANPDAKTAIQCMKIGICDYLVKPFAIEEFRATVDECMKKRQLAENLGIEKTLKKEIEKAHRDIRRINLGTIEALVKTVEIKDPYTLGHSKRVSKISVSIAENMGIKNSKLKQIEVAGLLHDIGKIGINELILNKTTRLTEEEFNEIKKHPGFGVAILKNMELLKDIVPLVYCHHEKFNGKGYPAGLAGEKIPLGARIIAVADAFDAMTSNRSYRTAWDKEKAIQEIKKGLGNHFDSDVVKFFIQTIDKEG
jgi:putative nucleotidyltransferase with HDIG domain